MVDINGEIRSFKDLKVWQRSMDIAVVLYKVTNQFPREELYGITAQIRKAAVSVPSNISEGFGRYHNREYKQFLHIALGSCAEMTTQLILAMRLEYVQSATAEKILKEMEEISKMLMALIVKVQARI
jgi:four helix bundle protein